MRQSTNIIILTLAMTLGGAVVAAPMTREQGDEIIKELREIRQLLSKSQLQPIQAPAAQPRVPQSLKIRGDARNMLGKADAPLTLVIFTDYQCPFCGRFETAVFPDLKKKFIDTGKVRYVMRDLALEFHPFAQKAAQAAACAGDQGRFWEMKDTLFRNQKSLDTDALNGYARELALNETQFKSCLTDGKYLKQIGEDSKYAQSLGITGTPTFVLGKTGADGSVEGRVIVGAQPLESFERVINEALNEHGEKKGVGNN